MRCDIHIRSVRLQRLTLDYQGRKRMTRTLPVNGRFTPLQRKIYDAVYEAQSAGIAAVRPGAPYRDFHRAAQRVLATKLVEWGLFDDGLDVEKVLELGLHVSSLTSYTSIAGAWHSTLSQTNVLNAGTTRGRSGIDLQVGEGRMADDLRSLKPKRTIQFDVMTEGQLALHMPVPTSVPRRNK
ncbi:M24 family metallopeptidase [Streptomyces halstedii]|uniref:M24 family metallopeptidase n=1 Tax=Streptomyces halstedii TaxID=1944 RepID=UPI003F4BE735